MSGDPTGVERWEQDCQVHYRLPSCRDMGQAGEVPFRRSGCFPLVIGTAASCVGFAAAVHLAMSGPSGCALAVAVTCASLIILGGTWSYAADEEVILMPGWIGYRWRAGPLRWTTWRPLAHLTRIEVEHQEEPDWCFRTFIHARTTDGRDLTIEWIGGDNVGSFADQIMIDCVRFGATRLVCEVRPPAPSLTG